MVDVNGAAGKPPLVDHKVAVDRAAAMANMREMVARGAMTGFSAGGVATGRAGGGTAVISSRGPVPC